MSTSLNIFFPPEDIAALEKQMKRRQEILGNSPEECIRIGFIAACKSMRASTKLAPKRRRVRENRTMRKQRFKGMRFFIAEGIDRRNGAPHNYRIIAPDLATAKLHPRAQIVKAGLAKASWGWAMHRLFQQPAPAGDRLSTPPGTLEVSKIFDRSTGYAEASVTNRLNYIAHALSGGRGPAVSTALARASENMRGAIDRILEKAAREAGY